jgi:1,4-dihydroxy-2-naphthoate octaprenyltransferase
MLHRSTIQLLRFHFSLFLLPVYVFALSQAPAIDTRNAVLSFFILHLLVYPSSNGYNSYMDRDETPIGGLANPLQPTRQLFNISVVMDVLAVLLSLFISFLFAAGILVYILASRAYSYRGIRLKRYPFIGFLTVFVFQGAMVFLISWHAVSGGSLSAVPLIPLLLSSLLIGALYPLTQFISTKKTGKTVLPPSAMCWANAAPFFSVWACFWWQRRACTCFSGSNKCSTISGCICYFSCPWYCFFCIG